jgi:hypothetical protein
MWFFASLLLSGERKEAFSIFCNGKHAARLSAEFESEIEKSFLREREAVESPDLPVSAHDFTALGRPAA